VAAPQALLPTAAGVLIITLAPALQSHRLDEYLQATRIAVSTEQLVVEIDLTPGAAIAESVVTAIDRDRDGRPSPEEQHAYAQLVLASTRLEVDGQPRVLTLLRAQVPDLTALRSGMGTIRLEAGAAPAASTPGRHQLTYRHTHREDVGAYLVNALTPATPRIRITGQDRDVLQRELRLSYEVTPSAIRWPSWWATGTALAVACASALWWRRRRRPHATGVAHPPVVHRPPDRAASARCGTVHS
jgi:hypothetical protein